MRQERLTLKVGDGSKFNHVDVLNTILLHMPKDSE